MVTAVFVNGNPETSAIWEPLIQCLDRDDVICLSPPGFGAAIPDSFECTIHGYRQWLISELEALPKPVDLVGHDVGGSTVVAVAMSRPDLIRTWASDSLGVFHPDYTWHGLAEQWQTPEVGERSVAGWMGGTLEERTRQLIDMRIPRPISERIAAAQGPEMGRAILEFYRSARQPVMAQLGSHLEQARARGGLAIVPTADELVGTELMRRESAARAGAEVALLRGLAHRWMVEAPRLAAESLSAFWRSTS